VTNFLSQYWSDTPLPLDISETFTGSNQKLMIFCLQNIGWKKIEKLNKIMKKKMAESATKLPPKH